MRKISASHPDPGDAVPPAAGALQSESTTSSVRTVNFNYFMDLNVETLTREGPTGVFNVETLYKWADFRRVNAPVARRTPCPCSVRQSWHRNCFCNLAQAKCNCISRHDGTVEDLDARRITTTTTTKSESNKYNMIVSGH